MTTLLDIYSSTDFLQTVGDTMPLYWSHEDGSDTYELVQPDGCREFVFDTATPVDVFTEGSVSINGINFNCYAAQQIRFNPDQE